MSDKVKLIIEIPKYYLEHPQDYSCLAECVRRGIPLEQIRDEIRDSCYENFPKDYILQIIDKHTKGEQE